MSLMAVSIVCLTTGIEGGAGIKIEFLLITAGSSAGTFTATTGAEGAPSFVSSGIASETGGAIYGAFLGGAGIFDL